MMDNVIHSITIVAWENFQYMLKRNAEQPQFYVSNQKRLIELVGNGGTLWLVTSATESGNKRTYQLACKLDNCIMTNPPSEYQALGSYAVSAGNAVFFPKNDVSSILLEMHFEPHKPIKERKKIGSSLQTIRKLAENDIALLNHFQEKIIVEGKEIPLSDSVLRVTESFDATEKISAWRIVHSLLKNHSDYGGGLASTLAEQQGPASSLTKSIANWIAEVKSILRPEIVGTLHGKLLILGLAEIDESLHRYLEKEGFLDNLKKEFTEPVGNLFIVQSDTAGLHIDSPEEQDRLGRKIFAKSLAARINRIWERYSTEASSSFILHIHGPWGSGKTTFLNFLKKELRDISPDPDKRQWLFVGFNAWRQQWIDPPWWLLLEAVYKECLSSTNSWWRSRWIQISEWWRRFFAGRKDLLIAAVIFLALAAIVYWPLRIGVNDSKEGLLVILKNNAEAISAILALIGTLLSAALVMSRSLLSGSARSAKTFVEYASEPMKQVNRHFKKLIKTINKPILVAIDDLDRCRRDFVVKLLEGIQTLFSDPRVVYVIAADRRWLYACFEESYEEFADSVHEPGRQLGSLFLEKAVQLSVTVPRLTPEIQKSYWDYLLGSKEEESENFEDILNQERDKFKDADTQEKVFSLIAEDEPNPSRRQARNQAAVEQFGTAEVETSTESFLSPFAPLLDPNPRAMKRFVNAYSLQRDLAILAGINMVDLLKRQKLALWTIISLRWPLLEDYLVSLSQDPSAKVTNGIRSLFNSSDVQEVISGTRVDVPLDLDDIREFAALRGADTTTGTVG